MSRNILVNLPPDFFSQPELEDCFGRLEKLGVVRKTSHNEADEIATDLVWADGVVMWSWPVLDERLLDRAGDLEFVGHIDLSQAGARSELARGIPTSTSRAGFSPAVAEMALGLVLNALRKISDYHAAMRTGNEKWVESFPGDIDPLERQLTGLTVGIIGLGQVGQRLAQLLKGFEVDLKVVDPYVPDEVLQTFQAERLEIDAMTEVCDVVVLCASSNDGTARLINAERCERFKKDAVFVNVARSALVDYEALTRRLEAGDLTACLDVFDVEPLPSDSILRRLPNVHLTPHRAGGLMSSVRRNLDWLIDDYEALLGGRARQYPVTEAMIPALDR